MNESLNSELDKLRQDISRFHRIEAILSDLNGQLSNKKKQETLLQTESEKENLDYEKISNMSISSLFYTILGNREEHIEKERQEALAAKLKLDQCRLAIKDLELQIAQLEKERDSLINCQQDYEKLLHEKYYLILSQHGANADKIIGLQDKLQLCAANKKELSEAITAGKNVISSADRIIQCLDSAEGWGTWDILGGGLLTDLQKHSHIDDAKEEASRMSLLLNRFHSELADVKINTEFHIDIDGFTKFADFFFDGLIADWVVQSKIHNAQSSAEHLREQVETVTRHLVDLKQQNEQESVQISREIEDTIANA